MQLPIEMPKHIEDKFIWLRELMPWELLIETLISQALKHLEAVNSLNHLKIWIMNWLICNGFLLSKFNMK